LQRAQTEGNLAVLVEDGNDLLTIINGKCCFRQHILRGNGGRGENHKHAGAGSDGSFDFLFPALTGKDVELVHPDIRPFRFEVFAETDDKFRIIAAVADKGRRWIDGQFELLARLFREIQERAAGPSTRTATVRAVLAQDDN
jgi:hypothetical protein